MPKGDFFAILRQAGINKDEIKINNHKIFFYIKYLSIFAARK
jgi:hypothetical protein